MDNPYIFVFELEDGTFRGVEAINEDQAREISELKGYSIKRLAHVSLTIPKGEKN